MRWAIAIALTLLACSTASGQSDCHQALKEIVNVTAPYVQEVAQNGVAIAELPLKQYWELVLKNQGCAQMLLNEFKKLVVDLPGAPGVTLVAVLLTSSVWVTVDCKDVVDHAVNLTYRCKDIKAEAKGLWEAIANLPTIERWNDKYAKIQEKLTTMRAMVRALMDDIIKEQKATTTNLRRTMLIGLVTALLCYFSFFAGQEMLQIHNFWIGAFAFLIVLLSVSSVIQCWAAKTELLKAWQICNEGAETIAFTLGYMEALNPH